MSLLLAANILNDLIDTFKSEQSTLTAIDFTIFTTTESQCVVENEFRCDYLKRIVTALNYYEHNEQNQKAELIRFCKETYTYMLDDYCHLIKAHGHNLQQIRYEMEAKYLLKPCDIYQCNTLKRHYRSDGDVETHIDDDESYLFYVDCFDRIHHQLFHLHKLGLRFQCDDHYEESLNDDVLIDKTFENMKQIIFRKRDEIGLNKFERFKDQINKFNLIPSNNDKSDVTFIDGLFDHLSEKNKNEQETLQLMVKFLKNNDYDSDALKEDLAELIRNQNAKEHQENHSQSNIFNICVHDPEIVPTIVQFIIRINCIYLLSLTYFVQIFVFVYEHTVQSLSFSTGQFFVYWDRSLGNLKAELPSISPIYDNLKQEVFSSGFMNIKQWILCVYKAQEYKKIDIVKDMKSKLEFGDDHSLYGIQLGQTISLSHILCIILYCDTNELQNHFSGSFRPKNAFEGLCSLKKRHQKYYHFAKNIIEAVNVYGITKFYEKETGPFYCGLSRVLNIGEFAIHLKAPTSTTKDIEVAINFASRDGSIVEFQNDTEYAQRQKMFDCSWISKYSEENERLFVAGMWRLRIESVRIIDTCHNHQLFFNALHIFDSILSMENMRSLKASENTGNIISTLIKVKLAKSEANINKYVLDCFNLYLLRKEKIIMDIINVYGYGIPLLFHAVHPSTHRPQTYSDMTAKPTSIGKYYYEYSDNCRIKSLNLLNVKLYSSLFPNLNRIEILNLNDYKFDLKSFLEILHGSNPNVQYRFHAINSMHSWPSWLHGCLSPSLVSAYKDQQWSIEYEKDDCYDTITISKSAT